MTRRRFFRFHLDPYMILTLLLSLFAIGPLLQPGYPWGAHDAKNSVYFLFEFDKSIQDGILWPRWGPDWGFGHGYPFWNIYGPLAYYVGEAVHLAGFNTVSAVKIVFALSMLGSAAAMYLFVRRLLGRRAAVLAGLVYVYAPYHLFDVYVRAALAESFSFVFVPLVFWAFYELVDRPRLNAVIGAGLAYAALVLTSNVLLLLVTPTLVVMIAALVLLKLKDADGWTGKQGMRATIRNLITISVSPILGLALGISLLAGFLLPAVLERGYVRLDQWFGGRYTFGADFVHFFQLLSPRWGFGASIPGPDDQVGFQLGLVPLILFGLSFLAMPHIQQIGVRRLLRFWQIWTLLTAFMMTPASRWLWQIIPLLEALQFPWRMGMLTATGLAIVAGVLVADPDHEAAALQPDHPPDGTVRHMSSSVHQLRSFDLSLAILSALIILGSYPYLRAQVREPQPDEGPVSLSALFRYQQSSDEMTGTTAWAQRIPGWSVLAEQVVQGGTIDTRVSYTAIPSDQTLGVHSVEMDSVHELVWVYAADERQNVTFMIPYYPGWTAYLYEDQGEPGDDLKARVGALVATPALRTTTHEGWIVVPVPAGEHFLELRFEDTPVRVAGKIISMASLLAILAAILYRHLAHRRRAQPRQADSPLAAGAV